MQPSSIDIQAHAQIIDLFGVKLDEILANFSEADTVGPDQRHKLRGILSYYAKKKHPFTDCVRDNTKRFGPDGAARVCATLKDLIYGTTIWRGKGNPAGEGPHPYVGMSAPAGNLVGLDELNFDENGYLVIEPEIGALLMSIGELDLHELLELA